MKRHIPLINKIITISLLLTLQQLTYVAAEAAEIRAAVASNFAGTIKSIVKSFTARTGNKVSLSFGSTGKHYAQIKNGAPFDVFFAADVRRPKLLEKAGLVIPKSRFTYAIGKIVLWSPRVGYVDQRGMILKKANFRHIAIANPKLAPYGRAAQSVLQKYGLLKKLRRRIVFGSNISQTLQFVKSGNVDLGFVAYSQIKNNNHQLQGSYWIVPKTLYKPIRQQAVLLKNNPTARAFIEFFKLEKIQAMIRKHGYDTERL